MPGQIDIAIAELLTGEKVTRGDVIAHNNDMKSLHPHHLKSFSTDSNAMLDLEREMRGRGFSYIMHSVNGWRGDEIEVVFYRNNNEQVTGRRSAKHMPLIFATQSFWALTGKEWGCE